MKTREKFQKQSKSLEALLTFDRELCAKHGPSLLIGFDEVGRGCVAGPVSTAAYSCSAFFAAHDFAVTSSSDLLLLQDSKKVSKLKRESLVNALQNIPDQVFYSVQSQTAKQVDSKGIVECIWTAMTLSLQDILQQYLVVHNKNPKSVLLLVDGPKVIKDLDKRLRVDFELRQVPVIRGDSKSASIAAASNLAKFSRDQYMKNLAVLYPGYSWDTNVGYGTQKHYQAIQELGLTKFHRSSYLKR